MKKVMLFVMALCCSAAMFAGGDIFEAWVTYSVNDEGLAAHLVGKNTEEAPEVNLGTVSKFFIDSFFVKVWQDNDEHFDKVFAHYRYGSDGAIQNVEMKWKQDLEGNNREWGGEVKLDIADPCVDGDHSLQVWFSGELNPNAQEKYLSNNNKNYVFNFTKGTPAPKVWSIIGSFNNWQSGFEMEEDENASLNVQIPVEAKSNYDFKIISASGNDTVWYGLPSEGNVMKYGSCTDWKAYKTNGDENKWNVGLRTTEAGNYTFSVDKSNPDELIFSVNIPEGEPEAAKWMIKGDFKDDWATEFVLTGEDQKALSVKIEGLEADHYYEFKLVRDIDGEATWFGLPEWGKMTYSSCTDWKVYETAGEANKSNVGLQTTTAGDYTFTVNVINTVKDGENDVLAPSISVNIPAPAPDTREKREIVFVAGEVAADNPTMIIFAFTQGKQAFDATMQLKENDVYTAEIPKELDSLLFVRAKDGIGGWADLIWEGEGKNVWNQSEDYFITAECDTATFAGWGEGEGAKFKVTWCGSSEPITGDEWFIKLPVAKDDWKWNAMDEEQDGTWTFSTTWIGGGANVNTAMVDDGAKYIKDEEMDFGANVTAPEEGTACKFIWNPTAQKLAVQYEKHEGIENVAFELDLNAPMFNILGVEVDADFHGIVIQNGHKYIR